jgi:glycosyltransferase involved in cell wall biosynthesis
VETKFSPMATIITPVLNFIQYLEPCIESILNQSYPYIEHIFIDGASTDGTVDVLSSYSTKYPDRVKFISEPDEGGWDAVNKGVRMAKGEIISFLGSDDMYEPDVIQIVVEFFRANPGAYVVVGDCNFINEKGEVIGRGRAKDFNFQKMINDKMYIIGTSIFYKREVFEKIGLFNTLVCDFDFLIRASKVFQIHRIDKVLSNFRARKQWVLSGSGYEELKMGIRDTYIVARQYGSSIFSGYSRLYYAWLIIGWLRPILCPIYPLIEKMLEKKRIKNFKRGMSE